MKEIAIILILLFPGRLLHSQIEEQRDSLQVLLKQAPDIETYCDVLLSIGELHLEENKDSTFFYLDMALDSAVFHKSDSAEASVLYSIGVAHIYYGNVIEAVKSLEKFGGHSFLKKSWALRYKYNEVIAGGLMTLGRYEEAEEHLFTALSILDTHQYAYLLPNIYQKLAIIDTQRKKYRTAIKKYLIALKDLEKDRFPRMAANILESIGSLFFKLNDFEKALKYFKESKTYTYKSALQKSIVFHSIGKVYLEIDSVDLAKTYFDSSLYKNKVSLDFESRANLGVSMVFLKKQQLDLSKQYALKSLDLWKQAGAKDINKFWILDQLIAIEKENGNFEELRKWIELKKEYSKTTALNDSVLPLEYDDFSAKVLDNVGKDAVNFIDDYIQSIEKSQRLKIIKEVEELEILHRVEQSEKEKQSAIQKNEIQKRMLFFQKLLIYGGLVLLILLGFLLFYIYRQNEEVRGLNAQLFKNNKQIELLYHDLEHRVNNNLTILQGLMDAEAKQIAIPEIRNRFEAMTFRIYTMSLVNEKLYRTKDDSINMKMFIEDLSSDVTESLAENSPEIKFDIKGAESFPASKALWVGLIINEVLTNACKYAFETVENPQMHISFVETKSKYYLELSDNGLGSSEKFMEKNNTSSGLELLKLMTEKLKATMEIDTESGVAYKFTFE